MRAASRWVCAGRRWLAGGVLGALLACGCAGEPKVLDPRAPPPREKPPVAVPPGPVAGGFGRVVLHGTDGSMNITARADETFIPPGMSVPPTRSGELCTTPCIVDLPVGRYKLYLVSADGSVPGGDVDSIEVREGLTYYVRAPGRSEPRTWVPALPVMITIAGAAALIGGAALLSADDDSTRTGGVLLLAAGGVAVVGGSIVYYDASRGTQQQGATTSWWEPAR
jgi:hypothetical protein